MTALYIRLSSASVSHRVNLPLISITLLGHILLAACHFRQPSFNIALHTKTTSTDSLISDSQRQQPTDSLRMDNGKLPQGAMRNGGGPLINVQPPRREDLQPSYAQTLQGDADAGAHGWYGSMSECYFMIFPENMADCTLKSQYARFSCRLLRSHPLLHHLPESLQAC